MCFYVRCFFTAAICVGNIKPMLRIIGVGRVSCLLFVMIALKKNINMSSKQDYLNYVDIYFRSLEKMERAKAKGKPFGTYEVDMRNASMAAKAIDSELVRYTAVVNLEQNKFGVITQEEIELTELRCSLSEGKKIVYDLLISIINDKVNPSESSTVLKQARAFIA